MCTNLFFWNVRGINDSVKHHPFVQWLSLHQPFIGALLETHIKEPNLNRLLSTFCPGWSYISNHNTDEDGRVIIIWKPPVTVQEIHQTGQSITCKVTLQTGQSFYFSAIYASNTREERLELWEGLLEVQQTYYLEDQSWLIGGDLNQILHHAEHSSPVVNHLTPDMVELQDFLLDLAVEDLRFQGNSRTWTNKCPQNPVTKKLDRALVNTNWIRTFPNSIATFLPHEFSDHSPCVVNLACPFPATGTKPFKFFNHLTSHPNFLSSTEAAWTLAGSTALDLASLGYKLKNIKRPLKTLHKERFSDIQKRVCEANSLLKLVQVQAMADPTTDLFNEERALQEKYYFLRGIEESFFQQKSRVNWLRLGDQNTPFYQSVACARASQNSIRSITLLDGSVITDPDLISSTAISHFEAILAPDQLPPITTSYYWLQALHALSCSDHHRQLMSSPPSLAEIANVLKKLNPRKSPGPDGFSSAFFIAAWPVVGSEVLQAISNFFTSNFLPRSTNATILTLVPKKPGATYIADYRPISCCNTTYKTISRLLVKRLKLILPTFILPNQTAFVQGRLLIENTLLASEIVQGYNRKGGQKRITIKVDIAKAFDTVRWEFLFACLRSYNIPEALIHWLEACVCTPSFSVAFNGSTYGYFKGKRGLRQGDPLSPYLFVLVMNCLSLALDRAAVSGLFSYHPRCGKTKLTHLSFADDLLIFSDGSLSSVQAILAVLKDFEERSGLAVSIQKTTLFAAGMTDVEVENIKLQTRLTTGILPIRYLGVPLHTKKISLPQCAPLIQSIKAKLRSWTVKKLTYAGRLQLVTSVINGITNFWTSSFILPKAVTREIDSLCAKFLWKGDITATASAKVSWESCCLSKEEGGLGLRNLEAWNMACALKMIWLLFFAKESIWSVWFRAEILDGNIDLFWVINTRQKHSWLVNKLLDSREVVYPWIKKQVQSGETTYFWSSNWSPYGKLSVYLNNAGSSRYPVRKDTTLAELWENGAWTLPNARSDRQLEVISYLSTLTLNDYNDDFEWWPGAHRQNKFRTGALYHLLRPTALTVSWHREVWFSGGIPKHMFLVWLMVRNRCPTRDRIRSWGLQTDPRCLYCNAADESIAHCYFECSFTWGIWKEIAAKCRFASVRQWSNLLPQLNSHTTNKVSKTLLLLCWQATLYILWMERNNRLHNANFTAPDGLIAQIKLTVKNRISSLRTDRPKFSSSLLQLWFST